jgi:hypothetical protein
VLNKDGLGGAHDRIILFTERNPVNFDCVHLSTESTLSLDFFFFFRMCLPTRGWVRRSCSSVGGAVFKLIPGA